MQAKCRMLHPTARQPTLFVPKEPPLPEPIHYEPTPLAPIEEEKDKPRIRSSSF
jgi:hypothetical protein